MPKAARAVVGSAGPPCANAGQFLLDECVMDGGDGTVGLGLINDDADLDLAGRDHVDVDILAGKGFEHGGGNARVALHAGADDADLGKALVNGDVTAAKTAGMFLQHRNGAFGISEGYGEDQVFVAVGAGALQDDIHIDVALGQQAEDLEGGAGHIRDPQNRDNGNVVIFGNAFDKHTFTLVSSFTMVPGIGL